LIKPGHVKKDMLTRLIDILLGWFFRLFNRTFDLGIAGYGAVVRRLLRVSALVFVVYFGLLALTGFMFQKVPGGFIPTMDQGYLIVFAQLPDGASLQRNDDVRRRIGEIGKKIPGVELTFAIEGFSILDSTNKPNALTVFFPLKPFSERIGHPEQSAAAIVAKLQTAFASIQDAFVVAIQPPSVRGLGNAGGFQLEIEDRQNSGLNRAATGHGRRDRGGERGAGLKRSFYYLSFSGAAILSEHRPGKGADLECADQLGVCGPPKLSWNQLRERLQLPRTNLSGKFAK
jgi:multidrug efflux pump subunit AcrB